MVDKVKEHKLVMEDRSKLTLSGVKKVESFDPKEIILVTEQGMLSIKGGQLGIKHLDLQNGAVEVEGHVDLLSYPRNAHDGSRPSLLSRIFR